MFTSEAYVWNSCRRVAPQLSPVEAPRLALVSQIVLDVRPAGAEPSRWVEQAVTLGRALETTGAHRVHEADPRLASGDSLARHLPTYLRCRS